MDTGASEQVGLGGAAQLAERALGAIVWTAAAVSALWIFGLMLLVCADVLSRTLVNAPVLGVTEIVSLSVSGLVFLAVPLAIRTTRFLRADLVYGKFLQAYPASGLLLSAFFNLAGTAVFVMVAKGLWPKLETAWRTGEFFGAIGVFAGPVWPFFAAMLVGASLATLQFAVMTAGDLARVAAARKQGSGDARGAFILVAFLVILGASLVWLLYGSLSPVAVGLLVLAGMLFLVLSGMHIATALIVLSFFGIWIVRDSPVIADRSLALAAAGSINSYGFGVIPLFILMGLFVDIADVGRDAFSVAASLLRRLRGGLGIATVFANAVFAAITGSSIASAAVFTRVAAPPMIAHGYTTRFAVGCVAGSSVLGMLIPPSLLLIVYGLIAEVSVGQLFTAAIMPGLLLAVVFSVMIFALARFWPSFVGDARLAEDIEPVSATDFVVKMLPIVLLVALVLGGIYAGFFTPTESGAVGAAGGMIIALARRSLTIARLRKILIETAEITASILFLIIAANLYSRMLTLTTIPQSVAEFIISAELGMAAFLAVYLVIMIVLGMFLDSVSIMLVVLPLMLPVVVSLGGDLVWFGVVTTIAVEIGLLTPPFGLAAYVVKGTLPEGTATLGEIFAGAFPFVLAMIGVTIVVMAFPALSLILL